MQPDLFAGPAQRDDKHRILARLANGGNAPARQGTGWNAKHRARLAAIAALLAGSAAAWVWRRDEAAPPQPPPQHRASEQAAPAGMAAAAPVPAYPPTPQAATIVNEPAHAAPALPQRPVVAALPLEPRAARARTARAPVVPHGLGNAPPAERDEDVTLLTAVLKHANGAKPAASQPRD